MSGIALQPPSADESVWSRDIGQALRAAHRVEAGWVQVNQGMGQVLVACSRHDRASPGVGASQLKEGNSAHRPKCSSSSGDQVIRYV